MTALDQLGAVSRSYALAAQEYGAIALAAADAEAAHRRERAKAVLRLKADAAKMAMSVAETRADADDEVAGLHLERLRTAAIADAHRARLSQLREQVAVGRSYLVQERTADSLHATAGGP